MGPNHYCTVCGRGMLSQIPLQTAIHSPFSLKVNHAIGTWISKTLFTLNYFAEDMMYRLAR